jgi:hypothetical protein
MKRTHHGVSEQMISAKSDTHLDEPRASGFREALQRLREYAVAGHLQLQVERRSGEQYSKGRAVTNLCARYPIIIVRIE